MAIQTTATTRLDGPHRLLDTYLLQASEAMQRRELGQKILAARLGKQWKQKQLAAAVSVEPDTVSRWENGRHAPDLDMLSLIAAATDQPLAFFVDAAEAPSNDDPRLEDVLREVADTNRRVISLLEEILAQPSPPGTPQET